METIQYLRATDKLADQMRPAWPTQAWYDRFDEVEDLLNISNPRMNTVDDFINALYASHSYNEMNGQMISFASLDFYLQYMGMHFDLIKTTVSYYNYGIVHALDSLNQGNVLEQLAEDEFNELYVFPSPQDAEVQRQQLEDLPW